MKRIHHPTPLHWIYLHLRKKIIRTSEMFEDHMYEGNNSEEMCNNKSYSSLDSRRGQAVLKETDDDIV